jgi:YVTN family beta-propeller protein
MINNSTVRHVSLTTLLAAALVVPACNRSAPESDKGPPPAAPAAPAAPKPPAAPSSGIRLYVSDETGGNVVVVDPDEGLVVERIAVGKRPRGLKLSRDGSQLLVALSGSPIAGPGVDESKLPPPDRAADGIGVVDLATHKLVKTHHSGQDPESFDISPDGTRVYVSNEDAAEMSVLDLTKEAIVSKVKVGEEPEAVTLSPDGRVAYVGCEGENLVFAVDTTASKVVGRIKTGARPRGIVFTSDGSTAFVGNENQASITVIDAKGHKAAGTIELPPLDGAPTPPRPMGGVLAPDGSRLYFSLGRAMAIAVIDPAKKQFVRAFRDVGARPWGIAISADGKKLYTANGSSGDISVVNAETGDVEKRITTGGSPWGVVIATKR